jgi:DNA modification methylase
MSRRRAPTSEPDRADDLAVEYWPLDRLIPYARNARNHSPAQVAEIAASIRTFCFTNPIFVSEAGGVIAGHGRLAAARLLEMTEVPVIMLKGLSEMQGRQLVLADNRIALNAGWDMEMLKLELADLSALGADLSVLGFSEDELAAALSPTGAGGLTDENEAPPLAEKAVSRPGDVWPLGPHRLCCGDSTDADTVSVPLAGQTPKLMVTDPPYGVEYDPAWRHRLGVNRSTKRGKIRNDERADWGTWTLFLGDAAYVWHGALHATTVAASLISNGFSIRAQIIWAKERLVIGRGDYHWQHEPCWYGVRSRGHWTGDRKQTTLWTVSSGGQDAETVHSTQKPVECMRRPMLNTSSPGQAIYDPFLGSGTTLIAAETIGRVCLGMEIDPLFVDVAVRRWQAFTGKEAALVASGAAFIQVERARFGRKPGPRSSSAPLRLIAAAARQWAVRDQPPQHSAETEMRGRKPKPTRLKVITGNPGKRPLNHNEPRPEVEIPECPPELGPAAQREWQRLVGDLAAFRLLTNLDRAALAAYCGAYALWAEAMEAIQKFGRW